MIDFIWWYVLHYKIKKRPWQLVTWSKWPSFQEQALCFWTGPPRLRTKTFRHKYSFILSVELLIVSNSLAMRINTLTCYFLRHQIGHFAAWWQELGGKLIQDQNLWEKLIRLNSAVETAKLDNANAVYKTLATVRGRLTFHTSDFLQSAIMVSCISAKMNK